MKSFTARISAAERRGAELLLSLEPNYFFPSGGGQGADRGELSWKGGKAKVLDVIEENGGLRVRIEGDVPEEGAHVDCSIDWERRHSLMKAHTSEHTLFQALSREFPGIQPEKVSLEPGAFSLFVQYSRPLEWSKVLAAAKTVNQIIREARPVSAKIVGKNEVPEDVRIKAERIGEEEVRIIEVEGFDRVACSGLHVKNTEEIELFCVSRITSDRPGIWKVDFLTGSEALEFLLSTSAAALSSAQILGTGLDRMEKTLANMKDEDARARSAMKELAEIAFASLIPEEKRGVHLYMRVFSSIEPKLLQEWASRLVRKERTMVIFAIRGAERAFLIFGRSNDIPLDVRGIGAEAFKLMGGKGGGNEFFVSGSGEAGRLDAAIEHLRKHAALVPA